jgi:hypothetical protein
MMMLRLGERHTCFVRFLMIHVRTTFHLPSSGGSLVTSIKVKGKESFCMTVIIIIIIIIILFYVLQNISPSRSSLFFKVYSQYHIKSHKSVVLLVEVFHNPLSCYWLYKVIDNGFEVISSGVIFVQSFM